MLTKDSLRTEFAKDYKKHYSVEVFEKEGFTRKTCSCGKSYWSIGDSPNCGDSIHAPYSFFKPNNKHRDDYVSFWKKFASFWEKNGHTVIKRYPVVSRWRPDLYFTMASIQDFQRLEKGKMTFEYPANPLMVPQISLRFNDIANVGVTGRHFSCFTMAGQHAFNPPKEGYWKDKCLALNFEFLTKVLGVKKSELTYTEDVWAMGDFSAFGPCVESFANGLELVNSVFMQYSFIKDVRRELDTKVIDVGWGFERLIWYSNGDYTAFDSVFPREIKFMEERAGIHVDKELFHKYAALASKLDADEGSVISFEEKRIAKELGKTPEDLRKNIFPLQAIYAIADHSRTLLFAISDGSLPSNVGGGYNLRVILRRALGFMDEYNFKFKLEDIMEMVAEDLKPVYPELEESLPSIRKILEVETARYGESRKKATGIVETMLSKGEKLSSEKMTTLYESLGITPELIEKVAIEMKKEVEIPTNFYSKITKKSFKEKEEEIYIDASGLPSTELLYYEGKTECKAKVLKVDGNKVVLDTTVFYPEGGGQATDSGTIGGVQVVRADKVGDIIVHTLKSNPSFKVGETVECNVDFERRNALMRHHTATHVVNAACRKVLGNHVWQAGAKKEPEGAHLDITHYEKIPPQTLKEIEALANRYVYENHPVKKTVMGRGEAEQKYGFILYRGGGSPGKKIRVIDIDGLDAEACGGLHVDRTGDIGLIKIVSESRIQDGINRIEFKAGAPAIAYIQAQEEIVRKASEELHIQPEHLPGAVGKFFKEWKELAKKAEAMAGELAEKQVEKLLSGKEGVIKANIPVDAKALRTLTLTLQSAGRAGVLVGNDFVVVCVGDSKHKAREMLKELTDKFGGNGGGDDKFAMGKLERKPF
ncbi:MAG: alanine--tRNA ligase [Candidatus Micrarchaeota archaeon]